MTTATIPVQLDFGRVLALTVGAMRRNAKTLLVVGLVCAGLPELLFALLNLGADASKEHGAANIASGISQAFAQAALFYTIIKDSRGERVQPRAALSGGAAAIWPLLGLNILTSLGIVLGLVLLIAPGLFLACQWAVAGATRVAEGPGVRQALSRSAELTKGSRWTILLFLVVEIVVFVVGGFGIGFLATLAVGETVASVVVVPILISLGTVASCSVTATLYLELLRLKTGGAPETLAAVFE